MAFWDGAQWSRPGASQPASARRRPSPVDWIATLVLIGGLLMIALLASELRAATPTISVTPAEGTPGTTVTGAVSGMPGNARVTVRFDGARISRSNLRTSAAGSATFRFTVPDVTAGEHVLTAEVQGGGGAGGRRPNATAPLTVSTRFLVAGSPDGPADLPSTPAPTPVPTSRPTATPQPATSTPVPTPHPTPVPTPDPTPVPPATPTKGLLFGLGPTVDSARNAPLTRESRIGMLTAWYNGPNDVGWMTDAYHRGMYAQQYAAGKALHLIVWTGDAETTFSTGYGTACGRHYPLSDRFLDDIRSVASAFAGSGQLYVTLFTEFQTYPCADNAWNANSAANAYYRALKDRYLEARAAIRSVAPGARVSLGWGGWQTRWDDPTKGGGRSMFQYFADVMRSSDFQSFQAMQSDGNVGDVRAMTRTLGTFGPVMLAHYKPDNGSQSTFDSDVRSMLTDAYLAEMRGYGLFAWSFMDHANIGGSSTTYAFVRDALNQFGR